jgi:CheY-like chemotaxis protein
MKTLIVEDDFTSRLLLQEFLKSYGPTHVAVNGREAVDAVRAALEAGERYSLICLDIMMPLVDGHEALRQIRSLGGCPGNSVHSRGEDHHDNGVGQCEQYQQSLFRPLRCLPGETH